MPFVQTAGARLYYEVQGHGEPLVCVSGLSADHLVWALQVPAFARHFRTHTFDNRDAGQSSRAQAPYGLADMARDVIELTEALRLDSFHLLGASMGGAIAQEVALAVPERIRTLTLCVSWATSGPWGAERARVWAAQALRASREDHVEALLLATLSEELYANADAVAYLRRLVLGNPHPQQPEAFVRQVEASGGHDARDRLPGLRMPAHVLGAGHDLLVPVWKSEELAELIPGAALTVLPGAPHAANIEQPEEFNAAVLDFLLGARARAA